LAGEIEIADEIRRVEDKEGLGRPGESPRIASIATRSSEATAMRLYNPGISKS
jgi:hypothetical protein